LKIKRREGQESNVWERFGDVLEEDDSSADYVMCDDCDGLDKFESQETGDFKYGTSREL
jgi:hypothetical protein